jgi:hypothetical protein
MKNNTMIVHQVVIDLSLKTQHQTDRSTILANTYYARFSQC